MNIDIITLFPELFDALSFGVIGRAINKKIIDVNCHNPRDFTFDKHKTVDDRPYGGGPGMLMKAEPLLKTINHIKDHAQDKLFVIYPSPQGVFFNDEIARTLASKKNLTFIAGRYEGIDERVVDEVVDLELSLGDFVLSGAELAILPMIDVITRQIPGVLGDFESVEQDSFSQGLLDHPHYTRPEIVNNRKIPEILYSGNHKAIEKWRFKQALGRTWLRKPKLFDKLRLSKNQVDLLNEFIAEYKGNEHEHNN